MRLPTLLFAAILTLIAAGPTLTACSKSDPAVGAETSLEEGGSALPEGALIEDHDNGSVAWHVAPDGQVKAAVKSPDGKLIDKNVSGELIWKGPAGETKVPLAQGASGLLTASGPKLEGDLTEVKYTLTVNDKPWIGALHLPAGGTPELAESAKKAAKKVIPKGKTGPNGGVIQVVGDDIVEVVADKGTGQVRVYVLSDEFKPIPVGERTIKIGIVVNNPEIITLIPEPGGLYVVGTLSAKIDPVKITIAITWKGHTEVVLCGYSPGVHVIVGTHAPVIKILIVDLSWGVVVVNKPGVIVIHDDDDDDDHHHHGHGHGHGHKHH